ncbi:MAG: ABC transporter substrate-binding protein, partial [Actinobacteria bacterium]|nr:ABC transporter substrate-binding protein [Actinomycetota bacterium]
PAPAEPAPPAEPPPAAEAPPASGTVDYLSWEGYDIPNALADWRERNGVEVAATYIGNHNDIQAKLKAGGTGYDIITYYQGFKPLYAELEIISPLDEAKIPNLANLFPFFAGDYGNYWVDPDGTRTGVPWTWGSLGLTYDESVIEAPTSYDVMFEPELKGKISIIDDAIGAFTQSAHILGFDVSQMTPEQFEQVKDYLRQIVAQSRSVATSYGDATTLLVSGEIVLLYEGWASVNEFARAAGKETIKTVIPEEGGYGYCDSWAIPPSADNVDTIYSWINESLDPAVHAQAATDLVAGVTVEGAVADLPETLAALYDYGNLDAIFEQAPLYPNPPVESDQYVTSEQVFTGWDEVKASAA